MSLLRLHDSLSKSYDMPPYDQFSNDMTNIENLKRLHSNIKQSYNLPEYDQFQNDMDGHSPYDKIKNEVLTKYPALKNVYGENGENLAISDNNKLPYGIEYVGKGEKNVDYGNGLQIDNPHPLLQHGLLINKDKIQPDMDINQTIAGDLLHGMRNDPAYSELYNKFKKSFEDSGLENDTKHWYSQADEETKKSGYDKFKQNDIDARIRILLQPSEKDYNTFIDEMTPDMKNAGNDIQLYLTKDKEGNNFRPIPDNYNLNDAARSELKINPNGI